MSPPFPQGALAAGSVGTTQLIPGAASAVAHISVSGQEFPTSSTTPVPIPGLSLTFQAAGGTTVITLTLPDIWDSAVALYYCAIYVDGASVAFGCNESTTAAARAPLHIVWAGELARARTRSAATTGPRAGRSRLA